MQTQLQRRITNWDQVEYVNFSKDKVFIRGEKKPISVKQARKRLAMVAGFLLTIGGL